MARGPVAVLAPLVANDLRLLWRHGLFAAYAMVLIVYGVILRVLPMQLARWVWPVMIASDPTLIGCVFSGALMLMEREWGVPGALAVSGVAPWQVVAARALAFAVTAVLLALGLLGIGAPLVGSGGLRAVALGQFVLATVSGSLVATAAGIILAVLCRSMNQFLFSLAVPMTVLVTPAAGLWMEAGSGGAWMGWAGWPSFAAFHGIAAAIPRIGVPRVSASFHVLLTSGTLWPVMLLGAATLVLQHRMRVLVLESGSL